MAQRREKKESRTNEQVSHAHVALPARQRVRPEAEEEGDQVKKPPLVAVKPQEVGGETLE